MDKIELPPADGIETETFGYMRRPNGCITTTIKAKGPVRARVFAETIIAAVDLIEATAKVEAAKGEKTLPKLEWALLETNVINTWASFTLIAYEPAKEASDGMEPLT